jgi:GTP-binding protein
MPGIIKGASEGKGLGLVFLRHIERTKILIYVVDISQKSPQRDLKTLQKEIDDYNPEILDKKQIVVFNKIDLLKAKKKYKTNLPTFYISAQTNEGVEKLLKYIKEIQP